MRKVINGKVYDTGTAKLVAEWDNGEQFGSFASVEYGLYRKKTGEFFLHVWGGAATRWAAVRDGRTKAAEHVVLVSYDEAREFAERHADVDMYGEVFGFAEDEATVTVTVRGVDSMAKALLDAEASRTGRTLGDVLSECVLSHLRG